jgi:hypothetical protein
MSKDHDGTDAAEHFIEAASEVTGGMAGTALGFVVGGPPGALGGAAVGPLMTRSIRFVAKELRERFLGPREEVRIGTTLTHAIETVRQRINAGEQLRDDGFFEADGGAAEAEEIIEGVLLAAQRSYEERKVPYHGRLLAGISFDRSVSRAEANHLLQLLADLSYQQFVLLQLFGTTGAITRAEDWRGSGEEMSHDLVSVLADSLDLYNRGLINNGGDVMLGLRDLKPAAARLQGVGFRLLALCGVRQVEDETEVARLASILNGSVSS